ncbi:MAG: T9SS type A sorting domain-containing protein [Bacteroidota bacterium]
MKRSLYLTITLLTIFQLNLNSQTYMEEDGVITIEAEDLTLNENWVIGDSIGGASEGKYIFWTGADFFGDPTNGVIPITLEITTPGTYLFGWSVAIGKGNSFTEHNDSWIKIDGDDFYAQENDDIAYPPPGCFSNPNQECVEGGFNTEGFFKVFGGGLRRFVDNAHTYDGSFYKVYVVFDTVGTYTFTLAARSSFHCIDKITLTKIDLATSTLETSTQLPRLTVYPNPVREELFLKGIGANTIYSIYNLNGKKMLEGEISDGKAINIEKLKMGYYILSTIQDKYIRTVRFTKQ